MSTKDYTQYYISVETYLMGRIKLEELDVEKLANLNTLIPRVNTLLQAYYDATGDVRKFEMSSGYRRPTDNKAAGGSKLSNHMKCAAIDLIDVNAKLGKWCQKNESLMETIGLWFEHPDATMKLVDDNTTESGTRVVRWLHCQCLPPKSGRRFFWP